MFIGIRLAPGQLLIVTASAEVLRYQSSASLSLNTNKHELSRDSPATTLVRFKEQSVTQSATLIELGIRFSFPPPLFFSIETLRDLLNLSVRRLRWDS